MSHLQLRQRTIRDFGAQWQIHGAVDDDYWSSDAMFRDHFGDLLAPEEIGGARVAEIGSGSGRVANMICRYRPEVFYAVEPSDGFEVLKRNTAAFADRIRYLNVPGEAVDLDGLDIVFSLGVIHHIAEPLDVVRTIHRCLRPGGRFVMWVYGREGNGAYLAAHRALSTVTRTMPDGALDRLSGGLNYLIEPYVRLCRVAPLPLAGYLNEVFSKCGFEKRKYIIFDQLNPAYAKYYRREEVVRLLEAAGFADVALYHRHGYSWTARATKR